MGIHGSDCSCRETSLSVEGERWRYVLTVGLSNITSLSIQHPGKTLNYYLEKQIQRFFRPLSLSRFEDFKILNISDQGQVSFHFFAYRHDLSKVREVQQRLSERGKLGDQVILQSTARLRHEQGLRMEGIEISNQNILEGEPVVLSCIAQGSEQIEFYWYKDGYSIDPNKSSGELWLKKLPKNSKDEYRAVLGIKSTKPVDTGRYTCRVADWGLKECRSVFLEVQSPPDVQISPMTASLNKGDNIDLTCVSTNHGVSYSWTKDRNLFALNPKSEVWEDLKPWGSILHVRNVQKSVTYICHAQTRAATIERSMRIDILIPGSCQEIEEAGIFWKPAASGSLAMANCPTGFTGHTLRHCLTIEPGVTRWEEPDFSNCISDRLQQIMIDFQMISRGYMKLSLWLLLSNLFSWLSSRSLSYHGEGEPVLELLLEIASYVNHTFNSDEVLNVTKVFYANVDLLLSQSNTFIHIEKVGELQALVDTWALMWSEQMNQTVGHLSYNEFVIDVIKLKNEVEYRYYIPMHANYPRWYTANIGIDVMIHSGNKLNRIIVVNYQNISKFLPRLSSQMLRDGTELIYESKSNIVSVSTHGEVSLQLEMTLPASDQIREDWKLTCARAEVIGQEWDFTTCRLDSKAGNSSRCLCQRTGLYAALIIHHSSSGLRETMKDGSSPIVALGCGCCLFQSCLTLLLLGCRRAFIQLLKIQFCFSVCILMAIFVHFARVTPSEDMFLGLTILVELMFFLAFSSHLGKLLIIYTEVVFVSNSKSVKSTVFGLNLGFALLPCLISGAAESSTSKFNRSWWLPVGSPSFCTAVTSVFLMTGLFLMLYFSLLRRFHYLSTIKKPTLDHIIDHRIGLMKRIAILFTAIVLVAIFSVIHSNSQSIIISYTFSFLSGLLGFLTFFCYVLHSESHMNMEVMVNQLKVTTKEQDYSSDSDYNLFNFFAKQEAEVENEDPPQKVNEVEITLKELNEEMTAKPKLVTFNDHVECETKFQNVDLEVYPDSPRKHSKTSVAEACVGVSSFEINSPTEVSSVIQPAPDEHGLSEETLSGISPTEVLNRISNDLDYLLNWQPSCEEVTSAQQRSSSKAGSHSSLASASHTGKTVL
nr:uncharacterized protein LOC106687952 [Halyomorpha halys]